MSYIHFKYRLMERYGLDITFDEYLELHEAERAGVRKEKRHGHNTTLSLVNFKGRTVYVVYWYTKTRCNLLTALPYMKLQLPETYYPKLQDALNILKTRQL